MWTINQLLTNNDLLLMQYALEWFHSKGHGVWSNSGIKKKFAHISISKWLIYFCMKICLIRAQRIFINCIFASYFIGMTKFLSWICTNFGKNKYAYLKSYTKMSNWNLFISKLVTSPQNGITLGSSILQ